MLRHTQFAFLFNVLFPLIVGAQVQDWAAPIDLSTLGINSTKPAVRVSSDGTKASAVWLGTNAPIIQAASATLSGKVASWSSAIDLSAVGGEAAHNQIAISSDGTKATAIWIRSDGSNYIVQTASATISGNSASWSSVTDLSVTGLDGVSPQIALSSDGTKATAVWAHGGIIQAACASVSGNLASWSSTTDLSLGGEAAFSPQIALSSDGTKATAVWWRFDMGLGVIQTASATVSGNTASWSSVTDLTATGVDAVEPQIALSADGTKATAIWRRIHGMAADYVIETASATLSGNVSTWGATSFLSAEGQPAQDNKMGLSADGSKVTVVWVRFDGSTNIVQSISGTISGNTASWGSVSDISEAGQDALIPQISLSSAGTRATAVWMRSNGTNTIIQAISALVSGTSATWGTVTDLSAVGQNASFPKMAMSSNGLAATAAWHRGSGANNKVQSASALISYPIATPSGRLSRHAPRPKSRVSDQRVTISIRVDKIRNFRKFYVSLFDTSNETLYVRKRIIISNGARRAIIAMVPPGIYRAYTIATRAGKRPVYSLPRRVEVVG